MNSKERVLRAIDHKEPGDRVPINFWGTPEVVTKLKHHFGVKDYNELLNRLNVDIRSASRKYVGPKLTKYANGDWEDYYGIRFKSADYGMGRYNEVSHYVLDDISSLSDIESHRWPNPDWFDYSDIISQCERFKDYAIICGGPGVFQRVTWLRRMDKVLMDMLIAPEIAKRLFEKLTDFHVEYYRRILEAGKGKIDILRVTDDFGTQNGLLMSPKMWRKFIAPNLQKLVETTHYYDAKFMLHSCGAIREIIPDLIRLGVDILDPIQTQAKGMDPVQLKRDFGQSLCFHGSMDIQKTLPFDAPDEVRIEVKSRIEILSQGGGFILAPTHAIQPDTPINNIIVMYETALQAKTY